MSRIPVCQSKKRSGVGGCEDPRCPEKMYYNKALDIAVANGNIDEFIRLQAKMNPISVQPSQNEGFDVIQYSETLTVSKTFLGIKRTSQRISKQSVEVLAHNFIDDIDFNDVSAFSSFTGVTNHVKKIYGDNVELNIIENYPSPGVSYLANISVKKEYQNSGVGSHVLRIIHATADKLNTPIMLEPAVNEAGRLRVDGLSDEDKIIGLDYQKRLRQYYERFDYVTVEENSEESKKAIIGSMLRLPKK